MEEISIHILITPCMKTQRACDEPLFRLRIIYEALRYISRRSRRHRYVGDRDRKINKQNSISRWIVKDSESYLGVRRVCFWCSSRVKLIFGLPPGPHTYQTQETRCISKGPCPKSCFSGKGVLSLRHTYVSLSRKEDLDVSIERVIKCLANTCSSRCLS